MWPIFLFRNPNKVLLILLSLLIFSACRVQKNYSVSTVNEKLVLDGRLNREQLNVLVKENWLTINYKSYKPDSLTYKKLVQTDLDSLSFLIFAGSWCSDTKLELPRFLKVIDTLNLGKNPLEMYFLDINKKSKFVNPTVYNISLVPTFLILRAGKEIGRIEETPKESIEKDVVQILRSKH
ncbi:MAG: hypothetical protein FGM41_10325 [Bacteroidetes bacterium]|nr:hypothetical protein [Bacteroidota bacterium]